MGLGDKIREARQLAGLTQSELAVKVGLSPQRISQYESDYRRPRPDLLARLAEELGVPVSFFSDNQYLSSADAYVFQENVRKYFEKLNTDPTDLRESGVYAFSRFDDDRYRPTKQDVRDFSKETGLSIDYLLGLEQGDINPALLKGVSTSLTVPGFDEVDVGLVILHILRFFQNDLHIANCSLTDAEVIASVLLEIIKPESIIPLAWLIDSVTPEIQKASLSVLNAGEQWQREADNAVRQLKVFHSAQKAGYRIESALRAADGNEIFFVTNHDDENSFPANIFASLKEAEEYLSEAISTKKTSQAEKPETKE